MIRNLSVIIDFSIIKCGRNIVDRMSLHTEKMNAIGWIITGTVLIIVVVMKRRHRRSTIRLWLHLYSIIARLLLVLFVKV